MEHNVIYNVIKKINLNLKKNYIYTTKRKSYVQKLQGFLILRKHFNKHFKYNPQLNVNIHSVHTSYNKL